MILAPISDPLLRAAVRRAALPEEDVFHGLEEIQVALRMGYPRVLIYQPEDRFLDGQIFGWEPRVPTLALTRPTLRSWEMAWQADGLAVSHIDDSALRLRSLIRRTLPGPTWVEGIFADLILTIGRGLAPSLRGFGRRVMEHPSRYGALADLSGLSALTPGALKARFRRRQIPSPALYLRWFRIISSAHLLADPRETTLTASYRHGFSSDGNFCRWIKRHAGVPPSALRRQEVRMNLLVRMAQECLPAGALEAWAGMGNLFLRDVA